MADFNNFLVATGLVDAGFVGSAMTWSNNRVRGACIKARLDRVLVNNSCQTEFPGLLVKHLPRGPSDHAPLLVELETLQSSPGRFIFQKMWTTHSSFMQVVRDVWNLDHGFDPNPLVKLWAKLRDTKAAM